MNRLIFHEWLIYMTVNLNLRNLMVKLLRENQALCILGSRPVARDNVRYGTKVRRFYCGAIDRLLETKSAFFLREWVF